MPPKIRLSVVIPTHNGGKTLTRCLQSLRRSETAPDEIVIVDDASREPVAAEFGARLVRLDKNVGAAKARNIGAREATGDTILFLDDDVELAPQAITALHRRYAGGEVDGVVGVLDRQVPFSDFASNLKNLWMRFTYLSVPHDNIGLFFTSAASMRREHFLSLGGFDENYVGASIAEDTDFGQRAWTAGKRIVLDREVVVTHHKHYTLPEVLRTDFQRARALTLMRLRKWNQKFFTSVPLSTQASVPILLFSLLLLLGSLLVDNLQWFGLLGLGLFYWLNTRWLTYLLQERGPFFAFTAFLFQPLDTAIVGGGMLSACVRFVFGQRY